MKLPLGSKVCQCSACGEYFSTPANFDKHRSGPWEARICLNPASVGLVKGRMNRWAAPSGDNHRFGKSSINGTV